MLPSRFIWLFAAALLTTACSVKEDRSLCPCFLTLDFTDVDAGMEMPVYLLVAAGDGFTLSDTLDMTQTVKYLAEVPRGDVHVRAWTGADGMAPDGSLSISPGQECPKVYMHDSDVRTESESVTEVIHLRKNHCILTVRTEGDEFPFDMTVVGRVCGYSAEGIPVEGHFECGLEPDRNGVDDVVLPRQLDSSLELYLDAGGNNVKRFAVGEYIAASGYDWTAPDLEDVSVTVDYALTEISLAISGWEEVFTYDIMF